MRVKSLHQIWGNVMYETPRHEKIMNKFLSMYWRELSDDICGGLYQKVQTTKQTRRRRAAAYIIESITGSLQKYPDEEFVEELLWLTSQIESTAISDEEKVAVQRTQKRLKWALEHPNEHIGCDKTKCFGCGQIIKYGEKCLCDNASAKARDRIMGLDNTIL